jgi:hypothetical protein
MTPRLSTLTLALLFAGHAAAFARSPWELAAEQRAQSGPHAALHPQASSVSARIAAAAPPMPQDVPPPVLGWDQEDVAIVAGWNVYTNDVRAQTVTIPRIEIPAQLGVIRLTVTAFNSLGMESEPSEPFWITNAPPFTNVVIIITARLVLTNPTPVMQLFSLCALTNPVGVWKPHAADLRIEKTHF